MGPCSHSASSCATAGSQHPQLARTQKSSQLPSGQVLVMEPGKALGLVSLVVPWLEKMLSSRLIGSLLKGQEEPWCYYVQTSLWLKACAFSASNVLQVGPLPSFGARRGVPDLSLYEGNLRSLLLLGTGRNRQGCWRDKGNRNEEEGPRRCMAQDPSAYL